MFARGCALLVLVGFAGGGCGAPREAERATVVRENVVVVQGMPGSDFRATENQLVFPRARSGSLAAVKQGDILVSGGGTGFIRRVAAVQGDAENLVFITEMASLSDAIAEGELHRHDDPKSDSHPLGTVAFSFGNTTLLDDNIAKITVTDGSFQFQPTLDLDVSMGWGGMNNLLLGLRGQLDAQLGLEIETASGKSVSLSKQLWRSPAKTFTQLIGWVPVVEVAWLSVGAGCSGSTQGPTKLSFGVSTHDLVQAAIQFTKGVGFEPISSSSFSVKTMNNALEADSLDLKCYAYVRMDLSFYDLVGPFVALYPYLGTQKNPVGEPQTYWGIEGVVGGQLNPLGADHWFSLPSVGVGVFDYNCGFEDTLPTDGAGNISAICRAPNQHLGPI
jgi:hypothetical protein